MAHDNSPQVLMPVLPVRNRGWSVGSRALLPPQPVYTINPPPIVLLESKTPLAWSLNTDDNDRAEMKKTTNETKNKTTADRFDRFNRPVQNLVEEIDITGCRFIGMEKAFFKRALWVAILIACATLTGYQMYKQIHLYLYAQNIATNLDLEIKSQLKFPAITLCSSTRTRFSAKVDLLNKLGNGTNGLELLEELRGNELVIDEPANVFLRNLAAQKDSFILQCKWWDGPCKDEDIAMTTTNTGICYTINGAKNASRTTKRVGIEGSLTLLLNIESYETVNLGQCEKQESTKEQQSPGVMVKIHSQDEIPMVENSLLLPTGFSHDLKMMEVKILSIDVKDGGTCCDQQNLTHYNASARSQQYLSTCQMDRLLSMIESDCNCRPFLSPNESQSTLSECSLTQHFHCVVVHSFSSLPENIFDAAIGRIFRFDANENKNEESCAKTFLSRNKTLRLRKEFMRASLLAWESSYVHEMKDEVNKRFYFFMDKFTDLLQRGYAPYENAFMSAYERLQKTSQCFKTITTKHAGYLDKIGSLLDTYPNAFVITASPEMSKIITHFSGNFQFDPLSLASYLVQTTVQFQQLFQVYSRDNFADTKLRSETLEHIIHLMASAKVNSANKIVLYEEMMSNEAIQLLTSELDMKLRGSIESDFVNSVLNVLDKTSVTTQYALKFAESLNKGDKFGNNTLLGLFTHDLTRMDDIDDIRAFVNLLLNCRFSQNELPMVATDILLEFNNVYEAFKLAYTAFRKNVADAGRMFIWDDRFVNGNLLQVRINFGDLRVQYIKQQRMYTLWDLLCDVGGTLGLFLGASVLTLFELIYLTYHHWENKGKK